MVRLVLSISIIALALGMAPASASAMSGTHQPDARISKDCSNIPWDWCDSTMLGDGIYNGTGRKQRKRHLDFLSYGSPSSPDPRVVTFKISIQNDGVFADRFTVDADGTTLGYVVKFLRKSNDITAAVEAGTHTTRLLERGATVVILAKVVMPCPSHDDCGRDRAFDIAERLVTVRSVGDSTRRDAVKFVRKPWECTC